MTLICSCKQPGSKAIPLNEKINQDQKIPTNENQRKEIDTIFLLNEKRSDNFTHKVYETWKPSLYQSFDPKITDEIFYVSGNQDSLKTLIAINTTNYKGLPKKWSEVIYYNNKFYLKFPSDFCGLKRIQINDGALIDFTCEGPWAYCITNINKTNEKDFEITLYGNNSLQPNFTVSLINENIGIYNWESPNSQFLMTNSENFRKLPIAKADCGGDKCPFEIKSQKVNY